ncbi:Ig-like domain-containing protein [Vibrio parahaemolyticus]|uniref:Ig-like domain-containing protein n=1 Tax=Vibrio parahaemolyticus TaxID=670 RepID=UPI0015E007D8|nr:Ig-like domain-containing protein [Vibrio parahaemolyticus]
MKTLWFYTITLLSLLLAGCNNGDDGLLDIPSGWSHKAVSLAVTPKSASIPMGLTQQLEADAVLNTGLTVRVTTDSHLTWTSSDAAIATVDAAGLVKGVTQGTVTITAEGINNDGSRVSDTATITVTDAIATALTVTPKSKTLAKGLSQAYRADALMSNGEVIDVTTYAGLTWSSSDTTVASISNASGDKGVAKSLDKGTTTIKAEGIVNGVTLSDTATLMVGDAVVANIVVNPATASVPVGLEQAFKADAVMTDGSTQDVTEYATWITSDPGTALVSDESGTKGIAQGRAVSTEPAAIMATITVDGTDYSASGDLTVTDAVVTAFSVFPKNAEIPKGLTQQFQAKATMSNGEVLDVTEHANVSWTSSDTAIASISNSAGTKGVATGESVGGPVTITATGIVAGKTYQDTAELTITSAIISSIQVTPAIETTPVGLTRSFTAKALLSDGTSRDITASPTLSWSTDNPSIATISNVTGSEGVAKGEAIGSVMVTATENSGSSSLVGTARLDVTEAIVTDLQVTPPSALVANGLTQQYTAKAILSDGSSQDVTSDAAISWTTNNSAIATISNDVTNKGTAKGESIGGPITITATGTAGGQTFKGTATLTVTDAVVQRLQVTPTTETTPVGLSKTFIARAFFSDSTSRDVTNDPAVSWSSSDNDIATVITGEASGNGVAKGESEGVVTIKASGIANGQTFENSAALTVTSAEVASMVVTPISDTTPVGLTKPFTATVTLTDGTPINVTDDPAISWSSSDPTIATVETGNTTGGNGVATGVESGTVTITATGSANGTKFTESAQLTVTNAVITDLQVTPANDTTPIGLSKQFTAIALLSDGKETLDVTNESAISWSSSNTSIATIDASGLATGASTGVVTITAQGTTPEGTNVMGTATLEVTDAIITSLVVTPKDKSVAKGLEQQFTATAYLSDGTHSIDVTNDPSIGWTTDDASVSISAAGLAKGEMVGSANVIATGTTPEGNTLSDSGLLTVTDAVVMELQVTPPNDSTPAGLTKQFTATALMSDGNSIPVTDNAAVSWTSSDTNIATITTGLASGNGVATGVISGTVTITAEGVIDSTTFKGEATLEVTNAIPQSLAVTPLEPSIAKGLDQQFVAEITYSDNSTNIVTTDPLTNWNSDNTDIATVTTEGLAHGVETGTTTITVGGTYDGVVLEDSTSLTVTDAEMLSIEVTPATSSVAKGLTQQFTAIATFTDGTQDITTDSGTSWVSTNTAAATISTAGADMGLASGNAVGSTTIQATNAGMTGTASLDVTSAELVSIDLEPDPLSVEEGNSGLLTALGTYTDTATDADRVDITSDMDGWTPVDTGIATVVDGTVTGVKFGSTTVTAMKDGITSGPATINVTPTLVSIELSPIDIRIKGDGPLLPDAEFADGTTETTGDQLTATGLYSDNSTKDITDKVTWRTIEGHSENYDIGIDGVVTPSASGYFTVSATLNSIESNSANITTCMTLAGPCLAALDSGAGKLFTPSPGIDYVDVATPDFSGNGSLAEIPIGDGSVMIVTLDLAHSWCDELTNITFKGRNNWTLATADELKNELYGTFGNMNTGYGWPTQTHYRSQDEDEDGSSTVVMLSSGSEITYEGTVARYVSCVSIP